MIKSLTAVFFAVVFLFSGLAHAGGTIVGVVRYDGEVPLAKRRPVTVDANVCGPEAVTQDLVLGKRGAVRNVVVSLEGAFEGVVRPPSPVGGYVLDEKGCRLTPHILVVPAGSDLKILNSDHLNHFYRVESRTNPPTSVALPKSASSATLHLDFPEVVELRCDIHEGERARVVVSRHPYIAVTDEEGRFEIKDVPVGNFTISFWQETLGSTNRRVQVREGEATRVDIILGPRKQSSFPIEPDASHKVSRIDVNVLPILTVR
ncbi:MAG TPA: carboxypeptidase regulatory-like domain-containing protein [bacterium]|nr:carboxypeptidase regulatory-like domain-containing protein [bacterium]